MTEDLGSAFEVGYNDQYLLANRSLDRMYRYVIHNPFWWWIRWEHPEYFSRRHEWEIAGVRCSLYGNLSLLDNAFIYPVIVHRAEFGNKGLLEKKQEWWKYGILNGGVVAGGFVNKPEQAVLNSAFENDGKVILFRNKGYKKHEKPEEFLMEQCAKGNLLIISPDLDLYLPENREFEDECHFMNDLARRMARI